MSEEIIKVLDDLGQRFGIAIDWSNQNIIPYLQDLMQRFISYKNCIAIMWIVISLVLIIVSIIVGILIHKYIHRIHVESNLSKDDENFIKFMSWLIIGSIIIGFTICLFCNIAGLFQNIYIPEVTILKYIQNSIIGVA